MPYCPKCDMEFIDGITTCSDCGGALVSSKEVADAMKRQEEQELRARQQAEFEAMQAAWMAEMQESDLDDVPGDGDASADESADSGADTGIGERNSALGGAPRTRPRVYVTKAQQYDDLKSSASAFWLIGGILVVFALLCWANVVRLPMAPTSAIISKSVITVMGIASLIVAFQSSRSAKEVGKLVKDEEQVTEQLIEWFITGHTGEELDRQIASESGDLSPEEMSLKRFDLIQDIIITTHDIADQSYVDLLAEAIYERLYQD